MRNKKVLFAVQAAMIAALYVVLTYITNLLGLASGTIQVRFSEALCILPVFTPAAIPGLFIGCLISNLITGGIIWDIIFGSIATPVSYTHLTAAIPIIPIFNILQRKHILHCLKQLTYIWHNPEQYNNKPGQTKQESHFLPSTVF